ncbi:MAG: hypothetical protein QXQ14_02380 [Candidatus Aenigmatarchaeota archaeon]
MNLKTLKEKLYSIENLHTEKTRKLIDEAGFQPFILTSYHPRIGISQNNIAAIFISSIITNKNTKPMLMAYVWDIVKKSGVNKTKSPIILNIENEHIYFRNLKLVGLKPLVLLPTATESEVESFFKKIEEKINEKINEFNNLLKKYFLDIFGHPFFWLRKVEWKEIKDNLNKLKKIYTESISGTSNLAEYIINVNRNLFSYINIPIDAVSLDYAIKKLPSFWLEIFSFLKNHTIEYNKPFFRIVTERGLLPLKLEDVKKEDFENLLYESKIVPSTLPFLIFFSSLGAKLIVEGSPTEKWYPYDLYIANRISRKLGYDGNLFFLSFGRLRVLDIREISDFSAFFDLLTRVIGKSIYLKGEFKLIEDTINDLIERGGDVPIQFKEYLKNKNNTLFFEKKKEDIIKYRLKFLGGIVDNKSVEGLLVKSLRFPTLLECLLYGVDINYQFFEKEQEILKTNLKKIDEFSYIFNLSSEIKIEEKYFSNFSSLISYLFPSSLLPSPIRRSLDKFYRHEF